MTHIGSWKFRRTATRGLVESRAMLAADSGYGGSVDASDRGYQMSRIACIKETKDVTVLGRRN
jgi:hypothetical protein